MNVTIAPGKCLACGMCTAIAPELFSIDSGTVTLKKDPATYTEADKKLAKEAAAACPSSVIHIAP